MHSWERILALILLLQIEEYIKNIYNIKFVGDDMLTFMEFDIEILFEERKTSKEMFDAISVTFSSSSKTYVQMQKI